MVVRSLRLGLSILGYGYSLWGKRDDTEAVPVKRCNIADRDASDMKHTLDHLRRETEAGFEVYDENTYALIKEVQILKREVKTLNRQTINPEAPLKTKRNEPIKKVRKTISCLRNQSFK